MTACWPVIGLVDRGGDVGLGEFDSDFGGQSVRNALDLPCPNDGHLTRIRPSWREIILIVRLQRDDGQVGSGHSNRFMGKPRSARCTRPAWHPSGLEVFESVRLYVGQGVRLVGFPVRRQPFRLSGSLIQLQ